MATMRSPLRMPRIGLSLAIAVALTIVLEAQQNPVSYQELVKLFAEVVARERPPVVGAAPNYGRARVLAREAELKTFQSRLGAIDPSGWPVAQQVDYALVKAELNGLDFDLRVLRPWER